MEVFQETIVALGDAYNKLADANIDATNVDKVLYKLHALKEDIAMVEYHITDMIITAMPDPPQTSHVHHPTPLVPVNAGLVTHPPFTPSSSNRSPYPLQTPSLPAQATLPPPPYLSQSYVATPANQPSL